MTKHKTEDGFESRVFSSMYLDWGLEISRNGKSLFYSPSCLSVESYGFHEPDEPDDEVEAKEWTTQEWEECLADEAADFIEAYIGTAD